MVKKPRWIIICATIQINGGRGILLSYSFDFASPDYDCNLAIILDIKLEFIVVVSEHHVLQEVHT